MPSAPRPTRRRGRARSCTRRRSAGTSRSGRADGAFGRGRPGGPAGRRRGPGVRLARAGRPGQPFLRRRRAGRALHARACAARAVDGGPGGARTGGGGARGASGRPRRPAAPCGRRVPRRRGVDAAPALLRGDLMDLLARLAAPGQDLLGRVDRALLAGGAPADHEIWPLLRRVGALPGDLVGHLWAGAPDALRPAGDPLRSLVHSYVDGVELMPGTAGWRGDAAEAFGAQWRALAVHLADGPDSMAARLDDTASYVDDVADWLARTRD